MKTDVNQRIRQWTRAPFDKATQKEVQQLIDTEDNSLEERFYKSLEFGTGGMRGVMGVGTNRINKYTLGKSTQGLANYLHKQFPNEPLRTVIAYDCRHNSHSFAQTVAEVFSANGIEVFLFTDLRPTPELSFAVRYLKCQCGIVLTASHNPPEYNGYKVYWQDGGQLVPPHDQAIIEEVDALDYDQIKFEGQLDRIHTIGQEVDEAFLKNSLATANYASQEQRKDLKVVFTALHGTSITMVPPVLERAGYTQLHLVKEQSVPNGDFPTVDSPNPEEPEALAMALALGVETQADIVIGTDPDCDRLGVAARNQAGELKLLDGNQTMVLLTDFLLTQYLNQNPAKGNEFIASTIVSTPLMQRLADHYELRYLEGLTGFKWIAKMVKDHPELHFLGGGEESFGYMVGDFVRDKDAVTATLLACEMAAAYKSAGKTLFDQLKTIHIQHGFYLEDLTALVKKGIEGAQKIKQMMIDLRKEPLKTINGSAVIRMEDYQSQVATDLLNGEQSRIDLPKSNVLIYYTADGSKIAARPSGTEPKIKFYISVHEDKVTAESYDNTAEVLQKRIRGIKSEFDLD
ncbi:phospho-sugar mutase [Croceiramulus getboli]|nr:phospho-sugar mutase [Flavobacteriaceae bacterium YJPT1-3]